MTTSSQPNDLTAPLRQALRGLHDGSPRALAVLVSAFAGRTVTEHEISTFLSSAGPEAAVITQLRMCVGNWDTAEGLSLGGSDSVPDPRSAERRAAVISTLTQDPELARVLTELAPPFASRSIVVSQEFQPWYGETRSERSSVYWDDYERYLLEEKHWSPDSVAALDLNTTAVIERLSDPVREDVRAARGLVVGYVQSGKTANFTGVIAKAIDAGYRLVIVTTGTIELLRAQTQRRLDMELMGVENILAGQDPTDPDVAKGLDYQSDEDWVGGRFIRHTEQALAQPGVARVRRVTSHHSDYQSLPQAMTQLRYDRRNPNLPLNAPENLRASDAYVVVVKKNRFPLQKLIRDLKPLREDLKDLPALIIDDESDLASVNTRDPRKDDSQTTINRLLTEIMELVPRTQYVGYTATPFANVFVDPDDESNIFPADFVLSLPRPSGYMGVAAFHDVDADWETTPRTYETSNELALVRSLSASKDDEPGQRAELQTAIDAWVLAGAVKKFRESHGAVRFRHHTMLIHENVRGKVHASTAEVTRELWRAGRFTSGQGLARLRELFDTDFLPVMRTRAGEFPVPTNFDELKPFVATAYEHMTRGVEDPVVIVNSDKAIQAQQQTLDFDADDVWKILIGGQKLSRGFTVEGLTTSYFRRKAGQGDTLMQAGRWFGFRKGYEDLVRLYIRRDDEVDLYEAFEALLLDEESFRDELRQYEGLDDDGHPLIEPRQIPPLVTQHLPWLRPTARNKMFNAVLSSRSRIGTFHQLTSIPPRTDRRAHARNLERVILPLLSRATQRADLPYTDSSDGSARSQPALVGTIRAEELLPLLDQHMWHPDFEDVVRPLKRFIRDATSKGDITEWAVVWPQPHTTTARGVVLPGLTVSPAPVFQRSRRPFPRIDFTGENKRNLLAASAGASGRPLGPVPGSPQRGVIVVSLVEDSGRPSTAPLPSGDVPVEDVVGLMSLRVPDASAKSRNDLVRWTVISHEHPLDATVARSGE